VVQAQKQTDDTVLFCRTQTGLAANHLWWAASLRLLGLYIYICQMTPSWQNALWYSQPITHKMRWKMKVQWFKVCSKTDLEPA